MIRVVIAEDEPLLRSGLRVLVEHEEDIEVVAEAGSGREALEQVRRLLPDVVLMDVAMPGLDGLAATRAIRDDPALGQVAVLVLTTFGEEATVADAVRAGAAGYLLKDVSAPDLRRAIREVAEGRAVLAPDVAATVMSALASQPRPEPELVADLAPRERDVLIAVGSGLSNAEVAERLVISPDTARTYVSRLLHKLDARDRSQLVVLAHRAGLVGGRAGAGQPVDDGEGGQAQNRRG